MREVDLKAVHGGTIPKQQCRAAERHGGKSVGSEQGLGEKRCAAGRRSNSRYVDFEGFRRDADIGAMWMAALICSERLQSDFRLTMRFVGDVAWREDVGDVRGYVCA